MAYTIWGWPICLPSTLTNFLILVSIGLYSVVPALIVLQCCRNSHLRVFLCLKCSSSDIWFLSFCASIQSLLRSHLLWLCYLLLLPAFFSTLPDPPYLIYKTFFHNKSFSNILFNLLSLHVNCVLSVSPTIMRLHESRCLYCSLM